MGPSRANGGAGRFLFLELLYKQKQMFYTVGEYLTLIEKLNV